MLRLLACTTTRRVLAQPAAAAARGSVRCLLPTARFATRAELAARAKAGQKSFEDTVAELFAYLERGLEPMVAAHPGMAVSRPTPLTLAIAIPSLKVAGEVAAFEVSGDASSKKLAFSTPRHPAGMFSYAYHPATGEWRNDADAHNFLENFVRDMHYCAKGFFGA